MNYLPKARVEQIVTQEANGELLIYDLSANRAMCLNETAKTVWRACDGKTGFDEFRKSNPIFSDELIWLTLEKLNGDNLFDEKAQIAPDFNGLSRREVIKKIGFGSMVMLPVIASIVAPTAAHAQSGSACDPGACFNPGTTANCSFGAIGASACVNSLNALCCSGASSTSSCSCPLGGPCAGSATCCGAAGNVVNGSFGAIGAAACVSSLNALCCSGGGAASCSCPLGGPCSGSITCS